MNYPRKLVIATGNRSKGREMSEILHDLGVEILTLQDFPGADTEVEETGSTYRENAELKAVAAAKTTGHICIADDAGLEIDALGGQPGLYSRRFLGEETPFSEKMDRVLEMLRDVPDSERGARFNCAVAIAVPDGPVYHCTGICEGRIGHEKCGQNGFGYDPIFIIPELGKHMAELPAEEKHPISHRGKALACAKQVLGELFS